MFKRYMLDLKDPLGGRIRVRTEAIDAVQTEDDTTILLLRSGHSIRIAETFQELEEVAVSHNSPNLDDFDDEGDDF